MLVGIYSDLHASKSMSILTGGNGYKYSKRLDLVVNSMKWMYDTFKQLGVDMIVNCGDTFDSDILLPEENSAMAEALSFSYGTPEIHLLGNHEKKNKSSSYTSVSLLRNYEHIQIVDSPVQIGNMLFLPYTNDYENYEFLDGMPPCDILFSHADYLGLEYDNGFASTHGFSPEILLDRFKMIFNGHIHSPSSNNYGGRLVNIGSLLGTGFGNSYSKGYPRVIILDTKLLEFKSINNPYAPLFLKLKADSVIELLNKLKSLDTTSCYCLKIEVPYELKDQARKCLDNIQESHNILASRVVTIIESSESYVQDKEIIEGLNEFQSSKDALISYIKVSKDLPCPEKDMLDFVNKYF